MLAKLLRPVVTAVFTPLAKLLTRIGITADMVTIFGTVAATVLALWLIPTGHLFLGALLIGIFALLDSVDGLLARMQGTTGPWGAFLDSTLDRISDGAIFTGITLWFAFRLVVLAPDYLVIQADSPLGSGNALFANPGWYVVLNLWGLCAALACLVLGGVIPYARARAGSLGVDAHSGFFERATRLVFALVPLGFVQFGLPVIVLVIALSVLAVGSLITVFQRMAEVKKALAENGTAIASTSFNSVAPVIVDPEAVVSEIIIPDDAVPGTVAPEVKVPEKPVSPSKRSDS